MKLSGKKAIIYAGVALAGVGTAFTILAARYEPTIRGNTYVGSVPIGGLSPEDARRKVRVWWEDAKQRELSFRSDLLKVVPPPKTPGKLGIRVDDVASVAGAPIQSFGGYMTSLMSPGEPARVSVPVRFKLVGGNYESLKRFVASNAGSPAPARVFYRGGKIVRVPETSGFALDEEALPGRLMEAIGGDGVVDLPLAEGPKRVSDASLGEIRDVVASYSTKFSAAKVSRSSNIKLAAAALDGVILMPGETMSFNNIVGERTVARGYKLAGVYANGRPDVGIGGGICQVSTTLYSAALFANLKIKRRMNHSMTVPYVPLGQDAAVSYGTLDLMIENSMPGPIAITSAYQPGKVTFRILGVKDPSLSVKIVSDGHTSWGAGVRQVSDPSLPAGHTRVIEKGSSGRAVNSYRLVYKDGELVERQPLGKSIYRGGVRIIAVGTRAPAPPPVSEPPPVVDGPPPLGM